MILIGDVNGGLSLLHLQVTIEKEDEVIGLFQENGPTTKNLHLNTLTYKTSSFSSLYFSLIFFYILLDPFITVNMIIKFFKICIYSQVAFASSK